MAIRPVFLPSTEAPYWSSMDVEFHWFPGLAATQKLKSIKSLHKAAENQQTHLRLLEVSTKSDREIGIHLSAFNLKVKLPDIGTISFESAFQGSKVFRDRGQISEAFYLNSRDAKTLARHTDSIDQLAGFRWNDTVWPLEPKSWFYDWLYIQAVLTTFPELTNAIRTYCGFTDIEFNPAKSFNCQARSCAIIASTKNDDELRTWVENPETMIEDPDTGSSSIPLTQSSLF